MSGAVKYMIGDVNTIDLFLDLVENKVEQLIVPLEDSSYWQGILSAYHGRVVDWLTFTTASEFDPYSLVDVLGEIEDGLTLAFT